MKKSIVAVITTAIAGGLVIGGATAATAHTPQLTADCHGITVSLTNYPDGSTVRGTLDGNDLGNQPFGGHRGDYYGHVDFDGTGAHTYVVDVRSPDKIGNQHYEGTVPACVVVTPPVTPPVTEPPVTTPPVTEPPVTTPPVTEPPVTTPPTDEPTEPPVTTAPPTEEPTSPPTTEPPVTTPPTAPPVTDEPTAPPTTEPPVTETPAPEPTGTPTTDAPQPAPTKTAAPPVPSDTTPPSDAQGKLVKAQKSGVLAFTGTEHVVRNAAIGVIALLLGGFLVRANALSARRRKVVGK